ncbi:MAG: hypothetical protein HOD97_04115 [Candidatus Marinimicrobia bacterium]|jgi:hypothetical protein|nr:hypothetical protein [Candidatus Neomarinimicrobiota bacterium]MBT3617905.1 hypothetical protein [Candidatus Neomarinimicrobiota bacterium]MBT3828742.1 hypothetical protein [Candidatus Neomarinimicrobiota bacterium]MBT3997033.1 hypothetical protein [Candidatus Neomarinimicrobiota bacterium]MBT4280789.1 hypothetical protein [Candidatus Neomarinimicrobiota bacterium]
MKHYLMGIMTGILMVGGLFILSGAGSVKDDSLKSLLLRVESYMSTELAKDGASGRFQMQSFAIDRTHWHYLLDTSTGELFQLKPSPTPGNGKWSLLSGANFEK